MLCWQAMDWVVTPLELYMPPQRCYGGTIHRVRFCVIGHNSYEGQKRKYRRQYREFLAVTSTSERYAILRLCRPMALFGTQTRFGALVTVC